ncbi:MAG: hypothetical protein H8F28_12345 [Fibrella sp.]|nr:hypothetical protein [Armatimonadota bacterium]
MADAPDTLTCIQCGATSPANQRFCGSCGAKLAAASGELAASSPATAGNPDRPPAPYSG